MMERQKLSSSNALEFGVSDEGQVAPVGRGNSSP